MDSFVLLSFWLLSVLLYVNCENKSKEINLQRRTNYSAPQNSSPTGFNAEQFSSCGIVNPRPDDSRRETPWAVGIFRRDQRGNGALSHKLYATGVLIGPSTILSVLQHTDNSAGRIKSNQSSVVPLAEDFVAAAGIGSVRYEDHDEFSQFSEINYFVPYIASGGSSDEFQLLIYHLKTPFNRTDYVREICLPHTKSNFYPGALKLQISGFAHSSHQRGAYGPLTFPTMLENQSLCDSANRYHEDKDPSANVVCTRQTRFGNAGFCHLPGSFVTYEEEHTASTRVILGAMLTSSPQYGLERWSGCTGGKLNFFQGIANYSHWLQNNLNCGPYQFTCHNSDCMQLSSLCNGIRDCPEGEDENLMFCQGINHCTYERSSLSHKPFMCGYQGKCLRSSAICNGYADCNDLCDEDERICSPVSKPRSTTCDPLVVKPEMRILNCTTERSILCKPDGEQMLGTVLTLACRKHYVSKYSNYDFVRAECVRGGNWEYEKPFSCLRDCGVIENSTTIPWHVNIFSNTDMLDLPVCLSYGGTLIAKEFVVTYGSNYDKIGQNIEWVFAEIGSTNVLYTAGDKNQTDKIMIRKLVRTDILHGDSLTLIKLEKPVESNTAWMPACYQKTFTQIKPSVGSLGWIPTVWNTETGGISIESYEVVECEDASEQYFCVNGTAFSSTMVISQGFFIIQDGRYFLKGIVIPGNNEGKQTIEKASNCTVPTSTESTLRVLRLNTFMHYMIAALERDS